MPPEPICKTLDRIVLTWNATSSSSFLELTLIPDGEEHIYTEVSNCSMLINNHSSRNSVFCFSQQLAINGC